MHNVCFEVAEKGPPAAFLSQRGRNLDDTWLKEGSLHASLCPRFFLGGSELSATGPWASDAYKSVMPNFRIFPSFLRPFPFRCVGGVGDTRGLSILAEASVLIYLRDLSSGTPQAITVMNKLL